MIYPGLLLQNRYRVVQRLGQGGQCETWEIDDCGTRKVLKVLLDNYPKAVQLFQREAHVLEQLNHPGIPKVEPDGYFTFQPEGIRDVLYCLVMEFIEGKDLDKWLKNSQTENHLNHNSTTANLYNAPTQLQSSIPENRIEHQSYQTLTQKQALTWLKQLVEILAQVHDRKYFHRDIKPSNIMLRPGGQLVLIDFGAVREVTDTYTAKRKQQDITRIYSQGYTAPEQFEGKAVRESDFFALGRTFVYLVTGKHPTEFSEDPTNTVRLLNWRDSAPQISKPLADLIDWLMEPSFSKRPKNAEVILQRLDLVSIQISIEPHLGSLPGLFKWWGKYIIQDEFQKFIKHIRTPKIALYGPAGSGKSSLINAILGKQIATVRVDTAGTLKAESYSYKRDGWKLDFVDSRGVRDSDGDIAFNQAIAYIANQKVDILLFVIPVDDRAVQHDVQFLTALKVAHQRQHGTELPIVLVLNKIDRLPPVREWNRNTIYNLSLEPQDFSSKPKTPKEIKEANIQACIKARVEKYQTLINTYAPICALWNDCECELYNIDKLVVQIYDNIPDEAAKNGFGGATAYASLKKQIAVRYTSVAAWIASAAVLWPFIKGNTVLVIQRNLVNLIAQIAVTDEKPKSAADKLLKQLSHKQNNPNNPIEAFSTIIASGQAAIRSFIDKEEITQVKQNYERDEEKLESELQEALKKGGHDEVSRKMKQIDAELHERYGLKRIYHDSETPSNIDIMQPLL